MLQERARQKEQLDNLNLSGKELTDTLDGLSVINKFFGNTSTILKAVQREIIAANGPLNIIDLGCGGGDNLRAISKWSSLNNHSVKLSGIDGNLSSLNYARDKNTSVVQIEYCQADILSRDFELPPCDVLISSHFMYHFSDNELVSFLNKAKDKVTRKIIFSELQRSLIAYTLFKIGSPILPFSKMVKEDGLLAIRRAFTKKDLVAICSKSDLISYHIKWTWAFRLLVSIETRDSE